MGLKTTLQNLASTVIASVGDIPVLCTYRVLGSATYNTATGQVTANNTEYTGIKVIFDDTQQVNLGSLDISNLTVHENERLFYIAKVDLTPVPKNGDELDLESATWEIIEVKTDPANALWILKGKKP
jgi:hypothetical protein